MVEWPNFFRQSVEIIVINRSVCSIMKNDSKMDRVWWNVLTTMFSEVFDPEICFTSNYPRSTKLIKNLRHGSVNVYLLDRMTYWWMDESVACVPYTLSMTGRSFFFSGTLGVITLISYNVTPGSVRQKYIVRIEVVPCMLGYWEKGQKELFSGLIISAWLSLTTTRNHAQIIWSYIRICMRKIR